MMFEKNQRKDIEKIKTTMQKYGLEDLKDDRDFKSCKNICNFINIKSVCES